MDIKEKFKEEFEKTCELVLSHFSNKNGQERERGMSIRHLFFYDTYDTFGHFHIIYIFFFFFYNKV